VYTPYTLEARDSGLPLHNLFVPTALFRRPVGRRVCCVSLITSESLLCFGTVYRVVFCSVAIKKRNSCGAGVCRQYRRSFSSAFHQSDQTYLSYPPVQNRPCVHAERPFKNHIRGFAPPGYQSQDQSPGPICRPNARYITNTLVTALARAKETQTDNV
jgi:hypothetical protein